MTNLRNLPGAVRIALALQLLASLAGCHSGPKAPKPLLQMIEEAHGLANWKDNAALAGDLHIEVENRPPLDLRFTYELKTGRTRMQLADNTILVWDGQKAWVSPASSETQRARFTLRTWPFFVALPFLLREGTTIADEANRSLAGEEVPSFRMTRAASVSDTPADWHIVYTDPQTHLLRGVVYATTYGRTLTEAEKNLHAITYYRYTNSDGVRIAQEWRLWNWNAQAGLIGMPIGTARVYNLEFLRPKPNAFVKPADAREDALP